MMFRIDDIGGEPVPGNVRMQLGAGRVVEAFLVPAGRDEDGCRVWEVYGPAGEPVPAEFSLTAEGPMPEGVALAVAVEADADGRVVFATPPQAWHTPN